MSAVSAGASTARVCVPIEFYARARAGRRPRPWGQCDANISDMCGHDTPLFAAIRTRATSMIGKGGKATCMGESTGLGASQIDDPSCWRKRCAEPDICRLDTDGLGSVALKRPGWNRARTPRRRARAANLDSMVKSTWPGVSMMFRRLPFQERGRRSGRNGDAALLLLLHPSPSSLHPRALRRFVALAGIIIMRSVVVVLPDRYAP